MKKGYLKNFTAGLATLGFVALISLFLFYPTITDAHHTDHAWATPNPSAWGTCTPKHDCGSEGTQTQTVSCVYKDGANESCETHRYELRYADKINGHCPSDDSAYTSATWKWCSRNIDLGPDTKILSQDCTLVDYKACGTPTPTPTIDPCADNQCATPTPTPTPTATETPSNPGGGPGDGKSDNLGCSTHDCSGNPAPSQGQVLGASTGPQVLGLSTTSGEQSALPLLQMFGALVSGLVGFKLFKKNA